MIKGLPERIWIGRAWDYKWQVLFQKPDPRGTQEYVRSDIADQLVLQLAKAKKALVDINFQATFRTYLKKEHHQLAKQTVSDIDGALAAYEKERAK